MLLLNQLKTDNFNTIIIHSYLKFYGNISIGYRNFHNLILSTIKLFFIRVFILLFIVLRTFKV